MKAAPEKRRDDATYLLLGRITGVPPVREVPNQLTGGFANIEPTSTGETPVIRANRHSNINPRSASSPELTGVAITTGDRAATRRR